jgi:glyoxylase-like metal-dependent hydrolase (beta-lactamase superfamily II)
MSKVNIVQLAVGPMMNYAYIIGDEESKTCAVVDPSWDFAAIVRAAQDIGMKITHVFLTHTHFDHANALSDLVEKTGAKVFVHSSEKMEIPEGIETIETADDDLITLGSLEIRCLHTPGHTAGSQCFLVDDAIFTGDTLFIGACGRTDLPGGCAESILNSLQKLSKLPRNTIVYPGHDYGSSSNSTIGQEIDTNPFMDIQKAKGLL